MSLNFYYGVISSAKSMNLIVSAYSYREQKKNVFIMKPAIDTRSYEIVSRTGLKVDVDKYINIDEKIDINQDNIFIDECQFLSSDQVDQLRSLVDKYNINIFCYGLKTDFKKNLFDGSKRLLEVSDNIFEIKTTCKYCNKNAIFSDKIVNKDSDNQIDLGFDKYEPVCSSHYNKI